MSIETPAAQAGPFAHEPVSISRTMGLVMLALLPATAFGLWQFGWPAIYLFAATIASALLFEVVSLRIAGKPVGPFIFDGSALLTGWLLAMTLPPWAPWWIGVVGSFMAIVIAKQVFGGIGQNLFNPAMVARVALLIAFPFEMTSFVEPAPLFSADTPGLLEGLAITFGGQGFDAYSGATVLGHVRTELGQGLSLSGILPGFFAPLSGAIGTVAGSMGETSAILILLGGLFLIFKRIITWHIPLAMLGTIAVLATAMNLYDPEHYTSALYHLVSGATLLGAFFIATDLVTSPVSTRGQLLFGAGCGLLVYAIRTWAGYPEGVAFAVLLMNACTPLIDYYIKPRVYGRDRKGAPIEYADDAEVES
ncbi:RnfABCDGE type electron transport complex subunit D [Thiorhodococcus mannitoliphagus]|uniref:Ion-translocating oxidoreductase complex subunit D n=1 Tax=Thiorhodococcus mannitoliphagus TaxID=329406 RepID=A0A6P1DR83_9GAMM|nr:RnfABCDGE type electron transport complex subunit D [Thiorhodococcus mannitoliphagus]NEX20767.1 RnfABCDGE type electron transport complex subunit D [Thiorhodococcus mannitoliphagus]